MPRLRVHIRYQDDGGALRSCRVLCKNSNDSTAQWTRGDVFIACS
jgi:hypothetical protein